MNKRNPFEVMADHQVENLTGGNQPQRDRERGLGWLHVVLIVIGLAVLANWAADSGPPYHGDPTGICNRPSATMGC